MAEAFSVFANDGVHRDPIFITKIEGPDGKVIYQADTAGQRVLPEQLARTETQVLTGVIEDGTGTGARIDRPAAGKTGTTTDYTDALFVGYTPQYTTAVWMGNPEHTNEAADQMRSVGGRPVTGGSYPASIWAAVMSAIHKDLPVIQFTPPDEKQWPPSQGIDEFGRSQKTLSRPRPASPAPTTVAPGATPSAPPAVPGGPDPNAPVDTVPPETVPAPPG
jgi:penicillin-binding protein 1A